MLAIIGIIIVVIIVIHVISDMESNAEVDEKKVLEYQKNTPGVELISDTIVETVIDPKSPIIKNLRNGLHGQYLVFNRYGMKYVLYNTRKEDVAKVPYSFEFAEHGKNPLPQESVEIFRDLVRWKLNKYPWLKVTNGHMGGYYDRSIDIEKVGEIPESFFGNF